ncbi:MAG: hypothetical protein ACP6IY_08015 [Promethearchaeia archaeon]
MKSNKNEFSLKILKEFLEATQWSEKLKWGEIRGSKDFKNDHFTIPDEKDDINQIIARTLQKKDTSFGKIHRTIHGENVESEHIIGPPVGTLSANIIREELLDLEKNHLEKIILFETKVPKIEHQKLNLDYLNTFNFKNKFEPLF